MKIIVQIIFTALTISILSNVVVAQTYTGFANAVTGQTSSILRTDWNNPHHAQGNPFVDNNHATVNDLLTLDGSEALVANDFSIDLDGVSDAVPITSAAARVYFTNNNLVGVLNNMELKIFANNVLIGFVDQLNVISIAGVKVLELSDIGWSQLPANVGELRNIDYRLEYRWDGVEMLENAAVAGFEMVFYGNAASLPLRVHDFVANARDNQVAVTWSASEYDHHHSTQLQRTTDGKTWKTLADYRLDPAGQPNQHRFQYFDHLPNPGIYYYRLQHRSTDGNLTYDAPVVVEWQEKLESVQVSVFPNPTVDVLQLRLDGNMPSATAEIFDAAGRLVLRRSEELTTAEIAVRDFLPGRYVLRLSQGSTILTTTSFIKN